ncbi:hypothetical protein AYL99_06934 [Fonsecaea erecta]|uniref:Uncharacterized protein n=1 Tax=Fonsecaea erecta TaxID=1367422 RepID=A0A178ZJQ3_9EURO|nr:hypothetical protein AYL99_06934 [Fonsecaea erecta]OAP59636.1 hypothetical protein AYL99_06934 [Fonsecaea erecta]
MPSSWMEEGEQFHHGHEHASHRNDSNEAHNPIGGASGSPAQFGSRVHPQTTSFSAHLPNNVDSFGTTHSPHSWGSRTPTTPISQERIQAMTVAAQYPDDIDRSRWVEARRPPNELDYSPAFSDSPLLPPSAAAARRHLSSDLDSLFEDSGSEEEEILYVLQRATTGAAEDGSVDAVLPHGHGHGHGHDHGHYHGHDSDQPSPCGLSRQLQGSLNVFTAEVEVETEDHDVGRLDDKIHSVRDEEGPQNQLPEQGPSCFNAHEGISYNLSAQNGELQEQPQIYVTVPAASSMAADRWSWIPSTAAAVVVQMVNGVGVSLIDVLVPIAIGIDPMAGIAIAERPLRRGRQGLVRPHIPVSVCIKVLARVFLAYVDVVTKSIRWRREESFYRLSHVSAKKDESVPAPRDLAAVAEKQSVYQTRRPLAVKKHRQSRYKQQQQHQRLGQHARNIVRCTSNSQK